MIISHAMQFVVATGATMVLARLLTPRDFGLLAMVSVLTGLVRTFKDFGLPMAIVYQADIDHRQLSKLFWLNLKLSGLVALFIAVMAPLMAWFFHESSLIAITLVIMIGVFATGVTNLHLGLLRRQMRFGIISVMEVGSLLVGAVVGISLALMGAGYWALVFQQWTILITQAGIVWSVCEWRPARLQEIGQQSDAHLQSLLLYSKYTTLARLLDYIGDELDRVLVGRFAGTAQLGLYQHAHRWSTLPVYQMYLPLKSVVIAGCSRLQDEPDHYRAYARNAFLALFAISLPVLAFLFVEAHDIILFLLGPQWLEAILLFKILTVAAFADCTSRVTKWVYLSEGQTKRRFHWTLISTPLMIAGMVGGVPWDAAGVAVGYTVATCVSVYPAVLFCLKTSRLRSQDFWGAVWRPTSAAIVAAAFLSVLRSVLPGSDSLLLRLVAHAGAFAFLYLGCWIAIPGGKERIQAMIALLRSNRASARELV